MDSTELRDQFRLDVVDVEEPQLWSDPEVFDAIDDAQKMFCRLTGGLADATSALTQLGYAPGDTMMATSPLILKVRSARDATTGAPVEVVNYEDLDELGLRLDGRVGAPRFLIIGMEEGKAMAYPTPAADGTIALMVDRLPLKKIDDEDQKLEVKDQHKTGLLLWVKARAYAKQDAETYDKTKALVFEQKFRDYCAEAKKEKERAKHKTRIVAYGGI